MYLAPFLAAILREYFTSRNFTILKYFYSKYTLCAPTDKYIVTL